MADDFLTQYNTNKFQRTTTRFSKDVGKSFNSGSVTSLGGGFVLLNATSISGAPGRLRLYSDQTSLITDVNRAEGNFDIDDSVALIADIVLSGSTVYMDPPIIGNSLNTGGEVWYHLSGSIAPPINVDIQTYPIKPIGDSTTGNSSIRITRSSVPTTGNGVSGSITTSKSFLILTGSSNVLSRLRLYSKSDTEIPTSEKNRAFGTQPSSGSFLIADLMFDSASFKYPLVPILEGYTWSGDDYEIGAGQVGYILQNRSTGTANMTASLLIYSTED